MKKEKSKKAAIFKALEEDPHDEMIKKLLRGETSTVKNEHGSVSTMGIKFSAQSLLDSLKDLPKLAELKKQLLVSEKRNKVLEAPLPRQQKEKIERIVAYKLRKKELNKWQETVGDNRLAECLDFTKDDDIHILPTTSEKVERFKPQTELELETERILSKSKNNLTNEHPLTQNEKELLKSVELAEAEEKLSKLQKMKALMSYQEAKYKRTKRIKSKRYRRILKHQRQRELMKQKADITVDSDDDTEGGEDDAEELDKQRIMERATLKHRSSNKWAKKLGRHRTKGDRIKNIEESLESNKNLGEKLKKHKRIQELSSPEEEDDQSDNEITSFPQNNSNCPIDLPANLCTNAWIKSSRGKNSHSKKAGADTVIDPNKFISVRLPESDDQANKQMAIISEAFDQDDVIASFQKEKAAEEKSSENKDIDLTLPGWGDWTGPGIDEQDIKKRRRFFIKAPPKPKRKDKNLPAVIISENNGQSIKKYQVSELPFPYTSVADFQQSIRHPLGPEWNTEKSFRALNESTVKTKAGRIIQPMRDEDTVEIV